MTKYGTTVIPNDEIDVKAGSSVDISLAFSSSVGLVGSMDTNAGSANEGTVYNIGSVAEADDKFGVDSELRNAVKLAFNNGVQEVYAIAPKTTNTTDSSISGSGTLANNPIVDIDVTTSTISARDTTDSEDETPIMVYSNTVSTANTDEFNINPISGDYNDDGANNTYDVTYDYVKKTNFDSAVDSILNKDIRYLAIGTEDKDFIKSAVSKVETNAQDNFDFDHVIAGGIPNSTPSDWGTNNTYQNIDRKRCARPMSARGYMKTNSTRQARTCWGVAGYQASRDFGDSSTNDKIVGYESLFQDFNNSEMSDWISKRFMPLDQVGSQTKIIKDRTTADSNKFDRLYSNEIVDEITQGSHDINQPFIGELNSQENRDDLRENHQVLLREFLADNLITSKSLTVKKDSNNADEVNVNIGVKVTQLMDTIDVSLTVGDVITNTQS